MKYAKENNDSTRTAIRMKYSILSGSKRKICNPGVKKRESVGGNYVKTNRKVMCRMMDSLPGKNNPDLLVYEDMTNCYSTLNDEG